MNYSPICLIAFPLLGMTTTTTIPFDTLECNCCLLLRLKVWPLLHIVSLEILVLTVVLLLFCS
jgi:hypothetical protein